jgi:hypothetical protein
MAGKSVSIAFDRTGASAGLTELESEMLALMRPAAQAAAQVLYDEVKLRATALGSVSGNLKDSIYQVFSADQSNATRSTYHVSWNARKAPHGHLVEYGHIQTRKVYLGKNGRWYTSPVLLPAPRRVAAQPFVRPAYDAKAGAATAAAAARYTSDLRNLLARLT